MSGHVPLWDRLGARYAEASGISATTAGVTPIPNDESILLCLWTRGHTQTLTTNAWWGLRLNKGLTDTLSFRGGTGHEMQAVVYDGIIQTLSAPYRAGVDTFYAAVVDRDNTMFYLYHNGVLVDSAALTNDPDLTAVIDGYMEDNGGTWSHTTWRASVMSIPTGQCPDSVSMAATLKKMVNPHAALPDELNAIIGSSYSNYFPGEGLYGSATCTDVGPNGDDLTWQGGVLIQNVRTRAQTPVRNPRRTWYGLLSTHTAATAVTDFGFAVQPVVMRVMAGQLRKISTGTMMLLINGTGTDRLIIENVGGAMWARARANGVYDNFTLYGDQLNGGDLWAACDGTAITWYLGGQPIHAGTLAAAINLSGNCQLLWTNGPGCRVTAWNPPTVPATLADEIRQCAMNVERDPASLGAPLVDFPLNSVTLPLVTSTTVANAGTGGGVLTLSAQRSTSTRTMITGYDP